MSLRAAALSLLWFACAGHADDLRRFQIWNTVGGSSGAAWGNTLLEVEPAGTGSLVRYVYAGVIDFACHRVTVMAWEKNLPAKTPADLAGRARLCQLTQSKLNRMRPKHPGVHGIEGDSQLVDVQCGGRRQSFTMQDEYTHPNNPYAQLYSRVLTAAWGEQPPDITVIDPAAEKQGRAFAEIARQGNYESYSQFKQRLIEYGGPIGKLPYEWSVSSAANLRVLQWTSPRGFAAGLMMGRHSDAFSLPFRLTLDRRSGKVIQSESLVDWNFDPRARTAWSASYGWIFDPDTVPENPVVNVTIGFRAHCPTRN